MKNQENIKAQIGIVDYGAGNIFSLCAALDRLQISYGMIHQPEDFDRFEKIIIPGVGHAAAAMEKLHQSGLIAKIIQTDKWVLGICVGMQLLTAFSEEGNTNLLNLFPLQTKKFTAGKNIKIPHTGWNTVKHHGGELFKDIPNQSFFYFVHSYFIEYQEMYNLASCNYALKFSAAIQHKKIIGVQFHPEKSGAYGAQLLLNFSKLS